MTVEHPRGIIDGRRGEPRLLEQVVSTRMDVELLAEIRKLAEADGIPPSAWIRNAAAMAVFDRTRPQAPAGYRISGWRCAHLTMTASGVTLGKAVSQCGCDLQPVYEAVPVAA